MPQWVETFVSRDHLPLTKADSNVQKGESGSVCTCVCACVCDRAFCVLCVCTSWSVGAWLCVPCVRACMGGLCVTP